MAVKYIHVFNVRDMVIFGIHVPHVWRNVWKTAL